MGHLRFDNAPRFCNNILHNLQMFLMYKIHTFRFFSNFVKILLTTGADLRGDCIIKLH